MSAGEELLWLQLLEAYDLRPPVRLFALPQAGFNNQSVGIHTPRGDYVAKIHPSGDDLASLEYEHRLLDWLDTAGLSFAVPVPLPTRDNRRLRDGPQGWISLTTLFPGACPEFRLVEGHRDPGVVEHAEALGAALGELQVALRQYLVLPRPGRSLFGDLFQFPPPERDPFALTPRQLGLPETPLYAGLFAWWRAEAAELQTFVGGPYRVLPSQVCHNDFAPANLLIERGRVRAVLDWEFATLAPRALDVAMGLRMTMQVWDNSEPWEIARHFFRGYARWIRLTEAEVLALPLLIRLRTAIPLLWWLGRRETRDDLDRIPAHIERVQRATRWLDEHAPRLVDLVSSEAG